MAESIERFPVSEKGYSLPINDVLTGRGFITGKSGSGKSNTASVVAEELLDRGLGLLIIDTDGEYSALKDRYELLQVGGDDACDREITAEDAPLIADLALEENVPIILDVSGYMDEEVADDVIHAVVRELFVAEKQHQKPFLLFVEEAHEFIPERGGGDDVHKMLVRVAKRGRKRGLGVVAMSQRPAAVAKDYITQCDWLVWHRLTWENDTKVAGRILGGDAAESVQSLDDGEALVMTDWDEKLSRVQFRRKKTIDRGSTPTLEDAYGPPSAREDHVTGTAEADDEATENTADDGDGDSGDTTGSTEDPEPATEEPRPEDDGGSAQDRTSNWDLSDVDIEPTQPSLQEASAEQPSPAGSVDGRQAGSGPRTEPATAEPSTATPKPPAQADQGHSGAGTPPASHGQAGEPQPDASVQASGTTDGGSVSRRRQAPLDEPDEYDPLWEIAQLIVYCYGVIAATHAGFYQSLRRRYTTLCLRFRQTAFGTYQRGSAGRIERRVGTALAMITVVLVYAIVAVAIVAGLNQYRTQLG
ncbi:hypothetical protein C479_13593 [Halovivax asiaticus JCM 14624]|uniref:Helicase HerA central domain-containing protein n=1 Tax=Halovivax asiaticus JCM 14624 TaxID=1227490 RepID=M0BBT4_9EURY|nr:DUF87 domain-containing protein [Halovivax asiaticus]ELZ08376.1 hypothetical protein C479_13593 [Halovivax asiaticus JCM 14624]